MTYTQCEDMSTVLSCYLSGFLFACSTFYCCALIICGIVISMKCTHCIDGEMLRCRTVEVQSRHPDSLGLVVRSLSHLDVFQFMYGRYSLFGDF